MTDRPASSPADAIRFRCPKCARRFAAARKDIGKTSKCPGCGEPVVVPAESQAGFEQRDYSDLFSFPCRLCGTQLAARPRHVGQKVRCPDCEAKTVVPEPPQKQAPQTPAAMEGPQYEIYDGDQQPWGVDLQKRERQRIPVSCRQCDTRMHVPPSAIDKRVVCPDCGVKTLVEKPKPPPREKVLRSGGDDYELDATAPPPEALHHNLYEEARKRPPAGYRDVVEREPGRSSSRPDLPAMAILRGWIPFWANPAMHVAVVGFFAGMLFVLGLFALILMAMSFGFAGSFLLLSGPVMSLMIWWGVFAFVFYEIVVESSEGNDRITNWPAVNLYEWIVPGVNLIVAVLAAAVPGYFLERSAPDGYLPGVTSLVTALVLPYVLLSQLETGMTVGVVSIRVLMSYAYAPLSWMTFYAIALGVERANVLLAEYVEANVTGWWILLFVVAAAIADVVLMLSYARLLGRLAWVIGEAVPAPSTED